MPTRLFTRYTTSMEEGAVHSEDLPSLTRRDFLKTVGYSAAAAALGGMIAGQAGAQFSGHGERILTACYGCPAGCSLIVHRADGQIQHIEINPAHPAACAMPCNGWQSALRDTYRPDRLHGPLQQARGGESGLQPISWQVAIQAVSEALGRYQPSQVAFLFGLFPDHLYDLATRTLGGMNLLRHAAQPAQTAQVTLIDAARRHFGAAKMPLFDTGRAQVIFSFGADASESGHLTPAWLFPPGAAPGARWEGRLTSPQGYRVQFSSHPLPGPHTADEWLTIQPGSEAILAQALATYVATTSRAPHPVGTTSIAALESAAQACGISSHDLERLACLFINSPRPLAVPGAACLEGSDGLPAAWAILALNAQVGNLGKTGGVFFALDSALYPQINRRPATGPEMEALVERIAAGQIKALFVHGVDPLRVLPLAYGFEEAIRHLDLLVSFSPFLDATARQADYILPDHTPLESWGYQVAASGKAHRALTALQPVLTPLYDTRSTADVLIQATRQAREELTNEMGFLGEVNFLQESLASLIHQGGIYTARDPVSFWPLWLEHGGWWSETAILLPPVPLTTGNLTLPPA